MSQLPITQTERLQLWVQELHAIIIDAADIEEAREALQHLQTYGLSDPDAPVICALAPRRPRAAPPPPAAGCRLGRGS